MRYNLTTPCDACPFLIGSGFTYRSLLEHASGEFACHKACDVNEETGNFEARSEKTPHCAGALIFLEKQNMPHQMMRICERLGRYDYRKLDMKAPVVASPSDCRVPQRTKRSAGRSKSIESKLTRNSHDPRQDPIRLS